MRRGTASGQELSGDNELQSSLWQNNDITLFPGESQTLTVTWNSADLQGATAGGQRVRLERRQDRHFGLTNDRAGLRAPGSALPDPSNQPMGDLMRLRHRTAVGLTITAAVLWPAAGTVTAAAAATYTPLPAHVYAPYYETYLAPNTPSIAATSQASGAKYFTLAFLQSTGKGSCSLDWNGNAVPAAELLRLRHRVAARGGRRRDPVVRRLQRRPRRHRDRRLVHERAVDRRRLRVR